MKFQIKPEFIKRPILTSEQLIENFLELNHRWFSDNTNGFFGYQERFKQYCAYRLAEGKYGPDYGDVNLVWVERYFDEYLSMHEVVPEKVAIGVSEIMKIQRQVKKMVQFPKPEVPDYHSLICGKEILQDSFKTIHPKVVAKVNTRLQEKTQKSIGKYALMVQRVYNYYPLGLKYMEIVELLHTGAVGLWDNDKRFQMPGHGATNLCNDKRDAKRPGVLCEWFEKEGGKWFPRDNMYDVVRSKDFQPFHKYEVK